MVKSESREPMVGASSRPNRLSAQNRLAEMQIFAERNRRQDCRLSATLSATPSCRSNGLQVYHSGEEDERRKQAMAWKHIEERKLQEYRMRVALKSYDLGTEVS